MGEGKDENKGGFIRERIKNKPLNKKIFAVRTGLVVLLGVLFGLVSAVSYTAGVYHLEKNVYRESVSRVELVADGADDEAAASFDGGQTGPDQSDKTGNREDKNRASDTAAEAVGGQGEDRALSKTGDEGLTALENTNRALYELAREASDYLLHVYGVKEGHDWFSDNSESSMRGSGLVVADNRRELLILVDHSVIQGAKEIRVLLPDDSRVRATEKKYDPNTGFSVIGVELADISDEAMSKIRTAKFGGSTGNSLLGKEVVAAGEPLGISDSLSYGIVTSVSRQIQKTDFNVRLLTTNIYGSSSGRGILVNLKGEIIGLITQDGAASGIKNLVCAYAISDVKGCIERMCNGQDRAYLGIHCTDVTDDISESLGIPEGVYVTKIDEDSPAMECGMQTGDVVTMIGTNEIRKYTDFQSVIDNAHPGDETVITVQRASIGGYSEISFEVKLETFR